MLNPVIGSENWDTTIGVVKRKKKKNHVNIFISFFGKFDEMDSFLVKYKFAKNELTKK